MDRVLPDIEGNARRQRKVFSDDGKKRISIVISLDFTRDVSRIKHRKPGSKAASQESLFLMGFCFLSSDRHLRVDGRTIAAFRLQGRTPRNLGAIKETYNKDPSLSIHGKSISL
jgi:hypothetical protein